MQFLRKLNKLGKIYIMLIIMGLSVGVLVSCSDASEDIGTFTNNSNGNNGDDNNDGNNGDDTSFINQRDFTSYIDQVDLSEIERLLPKVGANTIMSGNRFWEGFTPLTYAVGKLLNQYNENNVFNQYNENNAPDTSDIYSLKKVIDLLTDNGADINGVDGNGNTPLSIAVSRGSKDMAEYIIFLGATLPPANNGGYEVLKNAVFSRSVDLVTYLKDKYPSLSLKDAKFDNGKTLFFFANTPAMFQYLFDEGVDINEKDQAGDYSWRHIFTVIIRISTSVPDILDVLAKNGTDFDVSSSIGVKENFGDDSYAYSPLGEALRPDGVGTVAANIIKKFGELGKIGFGAGQINPNSKTRITSYTPATGFTSRLAPALSAMLSGNRKVIENDSDRFDIVKMLVDAGADLLTDGKDKNLNIPQFTETPIKLIYDYTLLNGRNGNGPYSQICEYIRGKLTLAEQKTANFTSCPTPI